MKVPYISSIYLILEFTFCLSTTFTTSLEVKHTDGCPRKCDCDFDLKQVTCHYKRLRGVPRGIPRWTKKLSLTGNHIRRFPSSYFRKLRDLEELNLNGNLLTKLQPRLFHKAAKLKKLDLSSNKLTEIYKDTFERLSDLEVLLLSHNKIGKLPINAFNGMNNIVELRIDNNNLQTLETAVFENMTSLTMLYLHDNKWHCDCTLKKTELELRRREIKHGYIVCDSPSARSGEILKDAIVTKLCGPDVDKMIGALLGVISGLIVFLFALFMCRKAANFVAEKEIVEKTVNDSKCVNKNTDESVRSSIISM